MKARILVVDDEVSILQSLKGILQDEGYRVTVAASGEAALEEVRRDAPDVVLLDIWMPGMDGLAVMEEIKRLLPRLPVIIISGHGSVETAVKATKMGAFDFVEKPLSLDRVLLTIQNALELSRLEEENRLWRQKANRRTRITGLSPAVLALREQIERSAPTNATVLITGENGTGKELVARMIHDLSRRSSRPMVEVNCAAIPDELIESELFGHEKGAFTGAHERRRGRFDTADSGTLFLDEVGDMSLRTQAKILRIIQEQVFERVGGSRPIQVDVRVLAATNKDLQAEIEAGRFRQDLYYRLNVIPIHVPPLRERIEDIPLLIEDFLQEMVQKSTRRPKSLTPEVIALLQRYRWPGNVRELRNFIERLIIMTPGEAITPGDLPSEFLRQIENKKRSASSDGTADPYSQATLREARAFFEREYLLRRLQANEWNITLTASQIGVERTHLHRKLKSLGIRESDCASEPDTNTSHSP